MGTLGNTPRSQTMLRLEARKSFAFGIQFLKAETETPIGLTGATVRLVIAQPKYKGGAVVLTKTATILDPALGLVQFALQATDLNMAEGEYPYAVTLVPSSGYSTLVLKGVVDVQENTDSSTTGTYTGINPATNLAAYVESGGGVSVYVDKLDGTLVTVLEGHAAATSGVHGLAAGSSVVGTDDTQTLSNKNLASPTISGVATFTGTPLLQASIELGRTDNTASTPYIDFHSGAVSTDRDARIIASGGNGASDGGVLELKASEVKLTESVGWTDYVPAWTASTTNPTLGNGTIVGRYKQRGKVVHFQIWINGGTTTNWGSGSYTFGLPVNCKTGVAGAGSVNLFPIGRGLAYDASVPTSTWGDVNLVSSTGCRLSAPSSVGSTTYAWADQDRILLSGTYEAV